MRTTFLSELKELKTDMLQMGAYIEDAIKNTMTALVEDYLLLAQVVINKDCIIDDAQRTIENLCLKLLLTHQPVATDMRMISSALKMITDMERIGDQAADIAEIVVHTELMDGYNSAHIKKMTKAVSKMVTESVDAFVGSNLELAQDVINRDDEVDDLFIEVNNDLIKYITENPQNASAALDLMMTSKYLERIGDHAVNIAEWVEFSITGVHRE